MKTEPETTGYESVAWWPDSVSLLSADNSSTDNHATKEQAEAVCSMLRREGFGGCRKIFPIKTDVRPIHKPTQENGGAE